MTKPYRSLYTYAWDVLDIGVNAYVEQALSLGISDVSLATSYHAGKFIRPHAKHAPKVIFPEDGVVYFDPQLTRYGAIKPQAHSDAALRQVLPDLIADGRLRVHGWTVLLHNSRLGSQYPQYCTHNVFGDAYVYSLCPMQTAVAEYAVALCADLTAQHPLASIILETPGWLPFAHGYHHEFAQLAMSPAMDKALGLCFCRACQAQAQSLGIEVDALQRRLQQLITDLFNSAPNNEQTQQAIELAFEQDRDLIAYVKMRQQRVTDLVKAIRAAIPTSTKLAVIPSVQRPSSLCWTEGSDLTALLSEGAADYLEIPFYEANAELVRNDAAFCLAHATSVNQLRGILRPGFPDLNNGAELADALIGLQQAGLTDFAFYNYGLLPRQQLTHMANCLNLLKAPT